MYLSDLLKRTMSATNTRNRECADALGVSPQNFSQRMKRDTLSLEQVAAGLDVCGASIKIEVVHGDSVIISYNSREDK